MKIFQKPSQRFVQIYNFTSEVMAAEFSRRPCFRCKKFGYIKRFCPESAEDTGVLNHCARYGA